MLPGSPACRFFWSVLEVQAHSHDCLAEFSRSLSALLFPILWHFGYLKIMSIVAKNALSRVQPGDCAIPVPWEIAVILQAGSFSKGYPDFHENTTRMSQNMFRNCSPLQIKESEHFTWLGLETRMLFYVLTLSGEGRRKTAYSPEFCWVLLLISAKQKSVQNSA